MIDKLGFEEFTFKKLSQEIQSSEASVYRYFDNKHKLLLYLSSLYWGWVEYQLVLRNANISDPVRRLSNAIEVLTISNDDFKSTRDQVDFKIVWHHLYRSSKAFLNKGVDSLNNHGAYANYKKLVSKISDIILEISCHKYPNYVNFYCDRRVFTINYFCTTFAFAY
ncbi:MAG: TetR family transcriptional regulator [Saprospiraceae bacterium]|nr:TetR family transcriptional regulator [Saprospiraceae bacterium]